MKKANIKEIFQSIQGEGIYVGEIQIFVRFCGCNLNCRFCDTEHNTNNSTLYTSDALINKINKYGKSQTISFTGGEPLLNADFLSEVLPVLKLQGHKIYLETNGTLPEYLEKVIQYTDVVAADIKLYSSAKVYPDKSKVSKFFDIAKEKETFAKVVFNSDITDEEIEFVTDLAKSYDIEVILQPEMVGNSFALPVSSCEKIFRKFYSKYRKIRLIPQMHKFLSVK